MDPELKALLDQLATRDGELKDGLNKALDEIRQNGKVHEETKQALDGISKQGVALQARLLEVEQKLQRRGTGAAQAAKSWGEIAVISDEFKSVMDGRAHRARVTVPSGSPMAATITSSLSSAGDLIITDRRPGIIAPLDRQMTVRDLVTPGRTSSNSIEYIKETGFTNLARPVTEGAAKPESDLVFDVATATVRTIATYVRATVQILADAPQLQSYIDGRLRYALEYVEETQLLLGSGSGQNLFGIVPQAEDYDTDLTQSGDTKIDIIRRAIAQARLAEYRVTGIVMHPTDWADIELTKDSSGSYVWSNPRALAQPGLWGLPVVDTLAMPEGTFLVGAFKLGAQIFDRQDATVEISTEDASNFTTNLVTIRAEERLAFAVYRPEAFVTGDFPAASE